MATNVILYSGSDLLAKILAGHTQYLPSHLYIEFTNGTFTPPAVTRASSNGKAYYDALDGVSDSDFLRVALNGAVVLSATGADFVTNKMVFSATAAGTTGINGQAFGAGSKVVGSALVCSPTGEHADDVVFARSYFDADKQITVLENQQVDLKFPVKLL
jgi:hypothetical protein